MADEIEDTEFTEVETVNEPTTAAPGTDTPPEPVISAPPPVADGPKKPMFNIKDIVGNREGRTPLPNVDPANLPPPAPEPVAEPVPGADPVPEPGATNAMPRNKAEREAKRLLIAVNMGLPMLFGAPWPFDDPNPKNYKLDAEEETEFIEVWADYIETEGSLGIPPWATLLFSMAMLAWNKLSRGFAEKKKRKNMQAEIEARRATMTVVVVDDFEEDTAPQANNGGATEMRECMNCGTLTSNKKFCSNRCKGLYQAELNRQLKNANNLTVVRD